MLSIELLLRHDTENVLNHFRFINLAVDIYLWFKNLLEHLYI